MEQEKNTQTKLTEFCFEKTKVEYKANNPKQKSFRGDKTWGIGSLKIRGYLILPTMQDWGRSSKAWIQELWFLPCGQTFMNNVSKECVNKRKIQKERFKEVEHLTCGNDDGTSLPTSRNTRCQGLVIVTCNIFIYLFRWQTFLKRRTLRPSYSC